MKKIIFALLFLPALLLAQQTSNELIRVKDLIPDIVLDLKYNTVNNFTHQKLYTTNECYLLLDAVKKLKVVQDSLRNVTSLNGVSYPKGLSIKIWDGYRPRAVQYLMWDIMPDPSFVADPNSGSNHNRGGAVDLTLVDRATGKELKMPTGFDDFTPAASHSFNLLTPEVKANRAFLLNMMVNVGGFQMYDAEWWHYNVAGAGNYPLQDFQMK
ncbi:MAG: M15 family metallopeptidase [Ignavibacteria bacterium]|jgi:D-alanyl-D-alanine dipeptidase|nr:M15 family metallopeptidase [Ignavibacteria bacterium]MCU7502105.1 M15 family metallopeptidase [Ignavibacteria bacterium]MCU7515507.1 M15 family metallopeptidase [Ignavibacteria bacterium]